MLHWLTLISRKVKEHPWTNPSKIWVLTIGTEGSLAQDSPQLQAGGTLAQAPHWVQLSASSARFLVNDGYIYDIYGVCPGYLTR